MTSSALALEPQSSEQLIALRRAVEVALEGKSEVVELALVALLARGHVLIEPIDREYVALGARMTDEQFLEIAHDLVDPDVCLLRRLIVQEAEVAARDLHAVADLAVELVEVAVRDRLPGGPLVDVVEDAGEHVSLGIELSRRVLPGMDLAFGRAPMAHDEEIAVATIRTRSL
jgi:hypothetical protein